MKFFVSIALIAIVGSVCASPTGTATSSVAAVNSNINKEFETGGQQLQVVPLNNEFGRFRKSAGYGGGSSGGYGAASIPAPPCPKNYLFSCQPNLSPVPCSAPSAGYGSAGAYSFNVPTYVAPVGNNYGLPQGYGGVAAPVLNQFYQY